MKALRFTTHQMEAALDRLVSGTSDLGAEAERLGVSADLFHDVLLQVIYVAAYLEIAASLARPERAAENRLGGEIQPLTAPQTLPSSEPA
jgi:hypothetical protein